jgi:hypothetical protein
LLEQLVTFRNKLHRRALHAVDKLGHVCSRKGAIVNRIKGFVWVVLAASSMMVADGAMAQRYGRHGGGRAHFGIYLGGPLYLPGFYPPSYYYPPYYPNYYPPTVVIPATPPVYIENAAPALPSQPPGQWWYYCSDSQSYYPSVAQCASPWQLIAPQAVAPQVVAPQGIAPPMGNQ